MNELEKTENSEFIFVSLLMVSNKMDTLLERTLSKYNVTSKQWFLLLVILNVSEKPPTIKEVAKEMGSSHQNVKQVALKLEGKGMLKLQKDKKDLRTTRLIATDKSYLFWNEIENDGKRFMNSFYSGIDKDNLDNARLFLSKIMYNLNAMEERE